jgi:hypothetical protein
MYLHAGSHKTGTTALQEILGSAAGELRQQGICWPLFPPIPAHHRLVRSVYGEFLFSGLETHRLLRRIRRQSRGCHAVVLSSEKIYRMGYEFFENAEQLTEENQQKRIAFLRRLRALFADEFDLRIILYLRRVDEFAESMYKELLFRKKYAGEFRFDAFLVEQRALFRYDEQIRELEENLAPVSVYAYETVRKGGLVEHFCSLVGAKTPARAPVDARIRLSASNTGALFLARLARSRALEQAERLRILAFCLSDDWPEQAGRKRSLWPTRHALEQFMQTYRSPGVSALWPPVDWDGIEFSPMADAEFERYRDAFERWSRRGPASPA